MNNSDRLHLTQPEIIQVLRRRAEMNQGTFGAKAFNTSFESGRTKIKNIELGRQVPTHEDLRKMAAVLDIPVAELAPGRDSTAKAENKPDPGIYVKPLVLDRFPGLGPYLEMLNKSVVLDDHELVEYIAKRIAALLKEHIPREAAADQVAES